MRKFRLFGVINPFDVLIVVGACVLVYGLSLFAPPPHVLADRGVMVRFEIKVPDMAEGFYREVIQGTMVIDALRGFGIGTIVGTHSSPFFLDVPDENYNIIRQAPVEGREITHVVLESWANLTDYALEIGPFHLRTGMTIAVRNFSFAAEGVVGLVEFIE